MTGCRRLGGVTSAPPLVVQRAVAHLRCAGVDLGHDLVARGQETQYRQNRRWFAGESIGSSSDAGRGIGGILMKPGTELTAIHPAVEAGVNNQDIDGLMALYAEDASMVLADGSVVSGLAAIREEWSGIIAMNGHITVRSRYAIAAGDLAVLSNEWTFDVDGEQLSSVTAEVARRQPDGGWLYILDHPYAGSEPDELATIMAATQAPTT